MIHPHPRRFRRALLLCLLGGLPAQAQQGREFLQWLKDYSPTGHHIITDGEAKAGEPGWHKQWLDGQSLPLPAVAVHETCHLRDGAYGSGNRESFHVGNMRDYMVTRDFTPFRSSEMLPDMPASLRNFQTEVYITEAYNAYSMVGGLIGIYGEWAAYITGLRSGVEMMAAFKAHFNSRGQKESLAGDMTSSIMSAPQFRYFSARYILWAQKRHPAIYAKITTGKEWRECYTLLALWEEQTSREWIGVLEAEGINTTASHGFDWYWKFRNELQKAEYRDLERIMLVQGVHIAPFARRTAPARVGTGEGAPRFDLRGRLVAGRLSAGIYLPAGPRRGFPAGQGLQPGS